SMTWATSSLDQLMGPRSTSEAFGPPNCSSSLSAMGATDRLASSTIMYSSSTPKPSNRERLRVTVSYLLRRAAYSDDGPLTALDDALRARSEEGPLTALEDSLRARLRFTAYCARGLAPCAALRARLRGRTSGGACLLALDAFEEDLH